MNGTKFYKLGKSNELLNITVKEELGKLEEELSSKISNTLFTIAEIVFSAVLALCLDQNINFLSLFPNLDQSSVLNQVLLTIVPCVLIFIATISIIRLIVKVCSGLYRLLKDTKKNHEDVVMLKQYFYQKVLNEITMGISLEKKAQELIVEQKKKWGAIPENDLFLIYLYESLYYYNEALLSMDRKQMIEIYNSARKEYTHFLKEINPSAIIQIFTMCINSLDRIRSILSKSNESIAKEIDDIKRIYSINIKNIEKQTKSEK